MKKIVTVVGARPQFVKAAAVSRVLRREFDEVLVHTGQHYDQNMSDIFFEELSIPKPDYNLSVGSGSHAHQTAEMLMRIEDVLIKEKPDALMVYGDTNSTLAGALAAIKIHIPVIHIEAGLRSGNMNMPEEVNRILTDRISDVLFCPTNDAVMNLKAEGIEKNVYNVGDVMCDAVLYYGAQMDKQDSEYYKNRLVSLKFNRAQIGDEWYLATIHRAENTDDIGKIEQILAAFEMLDRQVIFPVHPRTKKLVESVVDKHGYQNIFFCEPMGYIDMLYFLKHAVKAVTDSGGLQKEAYILDTPCVTVREQTEWVETLGGNCNILAHPEKVDIYRKVAETRIDESAKRPYYGKGDAAEKILKILGEQIK